MAEIVWSGSVVTLTGDDIPHVDYLCSNKGSHAYNGNIETCHKCKKEFHKITQHKCHYCQPCGKSFKAASRLHDHITRFHNNHKLNHCDEPDSTDEAPPDADDEAITSTDLTLHTCSKCHKTFQNSTRLFVHKCAYCKICDKLFPSLQRLRTHNKIHLGLDTKKKGRVSPHKLNSINSTNHKVLSPTSARRELLELLEGSANEDEPEESAKPQVKTEESSIVESKTGSSTSKDIVENSSDTVDTTIAEVNHAEEAEKEETDDSNKNERCVVETLTCQKCSKIFKGLVTLSMHNCRCCILCVRPFSTYQRLETHNNKYHPNSGHGNIKIRFTIPCPSSQTSDICRNHTETTDDDEEDMQESSSGSEEKLSEEDTDGEVAPKEPEEQQDTAASGSHISEQGTKDSPEDPDSTDSPEDSPDCTRDSPEDSPDSTRDLVSYFHLFRSYECYVCKEKFFKKCSLEKHYLCHVSDDDVTDDVMKTQVKFSNITRLLTSTNHPNKKLKTSHFNH